MTCNRCDTDPARELRIMQQQIDHLTMENARLSNRMAELQKENFELRYRLGDEQQMEIST